MIALERWPRDGLPDNPGAWIVRTARNRAIDRLRRERRYEDKLRELERLMPGQPDDPLDTSLPDDRLRLFFTCCHPALAPEARVALTLRTLGGLSTPEVARAFLTGESAMQQRLVRAKRKIRDAAHPLPGAARPRAARPAALAADRALPDLQRGLPGHGGRHGGAARAVRRGDPAGAAARRADARRERGARPAGADAAAPLAPRRARGRARRAGAARRPGPLALARRRDRRGHAAGRRGGQRRPLRACRPRSPPSTWPTRPTGRAWSPSTRGSPSCSPRRSWS